MSVHLRVQRVAGLVAGLLALGLAGPALAQYQPYGPPPPQYGPPPPPPPGYGGYYAQPRPPPPRLRRRRRPVKVFSLTFQPLMLAPIQQPQYFFEATAEVRAQSWLGLALIGGVGGWQDRSFIGTNPNGEVGVEVNFYPVGAFRGGLQLAPFARYFFDGVGQSLEWGGLIGYKWAFLSGFTYQIQLGLGVLNTLAFSGAPSDQRNGFGDGLVPNDIAIPWNMGLAPAGGAQMVGMLRFGIGWSI
ncbi:MAG: hypothetical protein ACYDCL_06555 [Myxococcales bacterium]